MHGIQNDLPKITKDMLIGYLFIIITFYQVLTTF